MLIIDGVLKEVVKKDIVNGSFTVPNDVVEIASNVFPIAYTVKKIIIPANVQKLNKNAFAFCHALEEVVIHNNNIEIESGCFYECLNLKSIQFPNLKQENEFSTPEMFIMPSSVKLGEAALNNCCLGRVLKSEELDGDYYFFKDSLLIINKEMIENKSLLLQGKSFEVFEDEDNFYAVRVNNYSVINYLHKIATKIDEKTFNFIEKSALSPRNYIIDNEKMLVKMINKQMKDKEAIFTPELAIKLSNDLLNGKSVTLNFVKKMYDLLKADASEDELVEVSHLLYNLGMFFEPIKETRTSKSGQIITEYYNYAQKIYEIFRSCYNAVCFNESFVNMSLEFKPEFAKFFIENKNYLQIFKYETLGIADGFLSNIYENFETLKKSNTSNRGSQHQLALTVEKCLHYFSENKFDKTVASFLIGAESANQLERIVGTYFTKQETFDKAAEIIKNARIENIAHNITSKKVASQNIFDKIDNFEKIIISDATETASNLTEVANAEFTYEFIDKHSFINFVIGKLCSCCSHLEGAGFGIMHASIVHPDVQTLVIRNASNEIIAKSTLYVNREFQYGIFNTVEVFSNEKNYEKVFNAYMKAIENFVETYNKENSNNPLIQINAGMGNNDIADFIKINLDKSDEKFENFDYSSYGYRTLRYAGDTDNCQYIVYKNPDLDFEY